VGNPFVGSNNNILCAIHRRWGVMSLCRISSSDRSLLSLHHPHWLDTDIQCGLCWMLMIAHSYIVQGRFLTSYSPLPLWIQLHDVTSCHFPFLSSSFLKSSVSSPFASFSTVSILHRRAILKTCKAAVSICLLTEYNTITLYSEFGIHRTSSNYFAAREACLPGGRCPSAYLRQGLYFEIQPERLKKESYLKIWRRPMCWIWNVSLL
jgi:hypothetical protein